MRAFWSVLSVSFFVGASLCAQTKSGASATPPNPLDIAVRAAQAALETQTVESRLSQSHAERLVHACSTLAELDADEHKTRCVGNPAVSWSIRFLIGPSTKISPRLVAIVRDYAKGSPPGPEASHSLLSDLKDPDARSALRAALSLEIDDLSVSYYKAAESGNIRRRFNAEAGLLAIYRDLKIVLGDKSVLLPEDPLALAGSDAINGEISALKAFRFKLDHVAASFPLPDTIATIQSIDERLARLETIISTDQPGRFNRARDDLAASADLSKWALLTPARAKSKEVEQARLEREWSLRYPALKLAVQLPAPQTRETAQQPEAVLSARALESTREYDSDPARWLVLESSLMSAHASLSRLPSAERKQYGIEPMPSFQSWRASLLTDHDLTVALAYSLAVSTNKSAFLSVNDEVPFAADCDQQRYRRTITEALQAELSLRKARGPAKLPSLHPTISESLRIDPGANRTISATEKLFRVRLAEGRYESPAAMPPLILSLTKQYISEVHDSDWRKARELFAKLAEQNDIAALSTVPLDPGQRSKLEKARADSLAALTRLDFVVNVRERRGYAWSEAGKRDIAALLVVLGSRPPPPGATDDPRSSSTPPDPTPPASPASDNSRSLGPNPKTPPEPLAMSDAPLSALFARASQSIAELSTMTAKVETSAGSLGSQKGKIVVSESQMRQGQVDFASLPKDAKTSRLPERLSKWKGFIDPETKKPYDYQTRVKNFQDFAPVGGGIHMGDKATLREKRDLSHFVLTYDLAERALVLVGPNERYVYGKIDPQDVKALYRYAVSGQNAAVSIGWAGEYDPTSKRNPGEPMPVLLDPNFVDTKVGQDLVAADSIPWDLGRDTLPGGGINPIAKQFKTSNDRFFKVQFSLLETFCRGVPAFSSTFAATIISRFSDDEFFDLVAKSLMSTEAVPEAKVSFLERTHYARLEAYESKLKQQLLKPAYEDDPLKGLIVDPQIGTNLKYKDLLDLYSKSTRRRATNNAESAGESGPDSLGRTPPVDKAKVQADLIRVQKSRAAIDYYARLFDASRTRLDLLKDLAVSAVENSQADSKWMQLLASVIRARKPVPDVELSEILYSILPTTTLAVLLDDPTRISIENERIVLDGGMRYRYATSLLRVRDGALVMTEGTGPATNRVETITELTALANGAMPVLIQRYEPLRRVTEYARIAAFLRWARRSGNLLSVDLSALGEVGGSDRAKTPTPDALASSGS